MKTITSRDNPTYRDALRLLRKKYRREMGMYLVEGIKPLEDALATGTAVDAIFLDAGSSETSYDSIRGLQKAEDLCIELSGDLFRELSDTEHSQGVIAAVSMPDPDSESFYRSCEGGDLLVLDRIQDPGNAGTLIRTAEAAGFSGVMALKGTTDIYAPKVVRAASGSLFRMPVITGVEEEACIAFAQKSGRKLTVTSAENGEDCFRCRPEGHVALVIGNEGRGVSERIMAAADLKLTIPMAGEIESLNAAIAAGILMYQISQRKRSG